MSRGNICLHLGGANIEERFLASLEVTAFRNEQFYTSRLVRCWDVVCIGAATVRDGLDLMCVILGRPEAGEGSQRRELSKDLWLKNKSS